MCTIALGYSLRTNVRSRPHLKKENIEYLPRLRRLIVERQRFSVFSRTGLAGYR